MSSCENKFRSKENKSKDKDKIIKENQKKNKR